jgi:nucleotide-binding universal stress UspA family protein
MDDARHILIRGGFEPKSVAVKVHARKKGVARDILKEARQGYTAVVLRRRGATGLRNIVMGSVAAKLMERLSFCPLIIVGRKPISRRVLIAVDGSEGANRAVDFVAETLEGQGFSAHLVNVIRDECVEMATEEELPEALHPLKAEEEILPVLEDAKARLMQADFASNRVTWRVITGVRSRAAAIAEEAEKENCETIVVGRRGLSKVKDFFIGRVSNKVVHLARKNTVWVVI